MRNARSLGLALAVLVGCKDRPAPEPAGLECIFQARAPVTVCPHVADRQEEAELVLSDSGELVLEGLSASRSARGVVVDLKLAGRFWSEADQNIYVFLGASTPGAASSYALTADPTYASDVGYPVRASIAFPHSLDVRVGVMAPVVGGSSPQVYVVDPIHADAVGAGAITALRVEGHDVHLEIPIDRYYVTKQMPVPDHLGVTVATARDYVGFIDQLTVEDVPPTGAAAAGPRRAPPMVYPRLDPKAHRFERVAMRPSSGGLAVDVDMAAPVTDWAQTNLHFFFVPVPPYRSSKPLPDPSASRALPYKWSFYCGVYSPRRVFCKASRGKDFTFDRAYAERPDLAPPAGVVFRQTGERSFTLELGAEHADALRAGRSTFALVVAAGRDGVGPTTWYGSPSHVSSRP